MNGKNVSARMATSHGSVCQNTVTAHAGDAPSNRSAKAIRFETTTSASCATSENTLRNRRMRSIGRACFFLHAFCPTARVQMRAGVSSTAFMTRSCSTGVNDEPLGRQRPAREEILGHSSSTHAAGGEDRLHVHRLPQRTRFNVFPLEDKPDVFTVGLELRGIDGNAGEPAIRRTVGGCETWPGATAGCTCRRQAAAHHPLPLVVLLHGGGGQAEDFRSSFRWRKRSASSCSRSTRATTRGTGLTAHTPSLGACGPPDPAPRGTPTPRAAARPTATARRAGRSAG